MEQNYDKVNHQPVTSICTDLYRNIVVIQIENFPLFFSFARFGVIQLFAHWNDNVKVKILTILYYDLKTPVWFVGNEIANKRSLDCITERRN